MPLNNDNYTHRMQTLLFVLFVASLTVVLHGIGTEHNWYWRYHWFDIITHLLGGFSLGLLAVLLYRKIEKCVVFTLGTVLLLIIGWEVFEVLFVSMPTEELWYSIGTIKDVVVGLLGAHIAVFVYQKYSRTVA
ncbi:MAG: hypothetical protein OXB96_02165 [Candidatus Kaiserbacteria bacterium]|nr:hypothetical protein [Candidatus Kaiserbacteria bacterium]